MNLPSDSVINKFIYRKILKLKLNTPQVIKR